MKKEEKSKYKLSMIISLIGIVISIICLILEIVYLKKSIIFWIILLSCNVLIFIGNYYEYKNR